MTDKIEFSVEIPVSPDPGLKPLPDWVAFDLCKAYPVPGGNLLLHNTRNGKRAMVMPEVYASLVSCHQFQTLDQHVANIIKRNPGMQGQQADIRGVLEGMLNSGIMVSAKQVSDELKRGTGTVVEEKEAGRPVVAVITWERPQALERLLTSIVANCDTTKLHCLYVIDDSRKAENISQNQVLVKKFASKLETPLRYFGQDEQRLLMDRLTERIPQHENAIRFLVDQSKWRDHFTTGLSRNLALFLSCGHRLVVLDDDTLCDVYSPPEPRPNITISNGPRETDFFGSEQEWAHLHQPVNPDPINRHMQCLGLTLSEALNVLGQSHLKPSGLANSTALQVSELTTDSPVLITECGTMGCPGTTDNTWLPNMAPKSLKQMLGSAEKTSNSLNSRKVWSGRNQPNFSSCSTMSQITGLDNRQMLPPYLPILRGEDQLFGNMLDFIFPMGVTLDYPWAIPHLPLPGRRWRDKDLDFTPAASFPGFFVGKVTALKSRCQATSPTDRLSALTAWFADMARASDDSLATMYRHSRLQSDSKTLEHLNTLLSEAESAPVDWQNYLRNGIRQLNVDLDRASRGDFPVEGLPNTIKGEELIMFWKDVWMGFAQALKAWPEIRKAAADIAETSAPP